MGLALFSELSRNPRLFSRLSLVVVGDLALDRSFYCRPSVPGYHAVHGSETIYDVERDDHGELGSAATPCFLAAGLGIRAHLFTLLGQDPEGRRAKEILGAGGIPFTALELAGVQTVTRYRFYVREERRGIYDLKFRMDKEEADHGPVFARAAREARTGSFLSSFAAEIARADAVYFNDTAKGFLSRELLRELSALLSAERARRASAGRRTLLVVVDPKNDWDKFIGLPVDVFKPNDREVFNALGRPWHEGALVSPKGLRLLARDLVLRFGEAFPTMVVTLGRHGALLLEAKKENGLAQRFPALELFPMPPHAATHCGDMFGAALTLALAHGASLYAATSLAGIVAAIQYTLPVGRKVGRDDLLSRANLEAARQKVAPPVFVGNGLLTNS